MANRSIRDLRGAGTPQFKFRFEVVLPALDGFTLNEVQAIGERLISISPLMKYSMPAETRPMANSNEYYLSSDDCTPVTMQFMEFTDQLTLEYFLRWRRRQINEDGTYNVPTYYKRDILVSLLDPTEQKVLRQITLVGCFISDLSLSDGDYGGSDPLTVDVELTYDGPKTTT